MKRLEDCPASDICKHLGNRRDACLKGSDGVLGPMSSVCIASLILLVDQLVQKLAEKDQ